METMASMVEFRKNFKRNVRVFFGCISLILLLIFLLKKEESLYDQAFAFLMENEGGYVNHPADPGGETKYGICKKYNPDVDIKNITLDFAKTFYYTRYWLPMYERIKDRRIAVKLFDISVHVGQSRLRELINETLRDAVCYPDPQLVAELDTAIDAYKNNNDLAYWEDYVVDKINSTDSDLFLNMFRNELINYYCDRIYDNNKLHVFRLGWIRRAVK